MNYWLEAVDQHSLHAPFIYNLYSNVFLNNDEKSCFQQIEALRQDHYNNQTRIQLTDLGAGGLEQRNYHKKVSSIARYSISPPKYCRLYHRIIEYLNCASILELGTSLGICTSYLAMAAPQSSVVTVEGDVSVAKIAQENFRTLNLDNINLVISDIDDSLERILEESSPVDFVLVDANHTYEATMRYFDICANFGHENMAIVFDDIYWSRDMDKAWNEIRKDARVSLSLDIYKSGIVFTNPSFQRDQLTLSF